MRQFDVFSNPIARLRRAMPFVVLLQSDRAQTGRDRVVAPLALRANLPPLGLRLIPAVMLDRCEFGILIPGLAGVTAEDLSRPVGNVDEAGDRIVAALDFLFLGI